MNQESKSSTPSKKIGRPTKYEPSFPDRLIEFFSKPRFVEEEVEVQTKSGDLITKKVRVPADLPMFEAFAVENGVSRDTLNEWTRVHPAFSDAYKKAKDLQKVFLVQNGLQGVYDKTFAIFTAKNVTDMRDQTDVNLRAQNIEDLIDLDDDDQEGETTKARSKN